MNLTELHDLVSYLREKEADRDGKLKAAAFDALATDRYERYDRLNANLNEEAAVDLAGLLATLAEHGIGV
jgi:hypothetical protein